MSKIVRALLATVMLFFFNYSHADDIHDVVAMSGYINKYCKRGCVDAGVLVTALQDAKKDLGVDPLAMLAIIRQESAFVVKAGNRGNVGLTQVLLRYHRPKFKTQNYTDAKDNVRVGSIIYKDCSKKHPFDMRQSFRCYNGYHLGDGSYYSKIAKHIQEIKALGLGFI